MGRSAGWLAYGAAMAGEASLVISVEDLTGKFRDSEEVVDPDTGAEEHPADHERRGSRQADRGHDARARRVRGQGIRRDRDGRRAWPNTCPSSYLQGVSRDEHGHIAISQVNLSRLFSKLVAEKYQRKPAASARITGLQLGYEARCAQPHAFDVLLGSQLGVGAYRALVEEELDGVMVSVSGQFELQLRPLRAADRPRNPGDGGTPRPPDSDFHRLARFLETYVNE